MPCQSCSPCVQRQGFVMRVLLGIALVLAIIALAEYLDIIHIGG